MKTILLKKTLMLVAIAAYSMLAFAQQKNEQIPEGKWVLENTSVTEAGVEIPFNADIFSVEVPAEIDVEQEEITFVYEKITQKVGYNAVAKANTLCIPICAEWSIVKDKLQLQWTQDTKDLRMLAIVLTYNRK